METNEIEKKKQCRKSVKQRADYLTKLIDKSLAGWQKAQTDDVDYQY